MSIANELLRDVNDDTDSIIEDKL
uniref:Putative LOC101239764 [Hydra vulgaris] n=1 Tax=Lepeophtheirus salmonis TaxID=72036 RepID=A0A0K2TB27_LEPSM